MATKQPPWSKQFPSTKELLKAMKKDKAIPIIPYNLSEDCRDFVKKCLTLKPGQRYSVRELLNHKFFLRKIINYLFIAALPQPIKIILKDQPQENINNVHKMPIQQQKLSNQSLHSLNKKTYKENDYDYNYENEKNNENKEDLVNILKPNQNNGQFSISLTVDSKSRYTNTLHNTLHNDRFKSSVFKLDEINKLIFTQAVKEEIDSNIDPLSPNPNDVHTGFFKQNKEQIQYAKSK